MPRRNLPKPPPKPFTKFPLFAHRNGSWKRKVDGVAMSFGPWRWPNKAEYEQSWKAALEEFHKWEEARAKGLDQVEHPEQTTITDLVDAHLTAQEARVGKGIEPRTFAERRANVTAFRNAIGGELTIEQLEHSPHLLTDYLAQLDGAFGYHRYNAHVKDIVGMFIAAEHPLTGALKRPFRLRPLLKRRAKKLQRREKREREADPSRGKQRFTGDELRAYFDHASGPLRAMIMLGYFAGFGNSDCADVPQTAFEFKPSRSLGVPAGWAILDWRRPKTEISRAAVLPAEVAEAVREAIATRPKPAEPKRHGGLVFLTPPHLVLTSRKGGLPFVRDIVHHDEAGSIAKTTRVDVVQKDFERLRDRLSRCPDHGWFCKPVSAMGRGFRSDRHDLTPRRGKVDAHQACPTCKKPMVPMRRLGFYTFRHTATTYAIPAASLEARVLFEGHQIEGVRAEYVQELDTAELVKIAKRLITKRDEVDDVDVGGEDVGASVTHSASPPSAA